MSRTLTVLLAILLVGLVLASLGGLVWANMHFVQTQPVQKDFLVPWLGARTFLQYGDSPYSDQATQRAQIVAYGRLATEGQDPLTLWLPLPFELFYFPIALIGDAILARAIWMTCVEIALVALAGLSLQLTGWKPGRFLMPVIFLFPVVWVYGAVSLINASSAGFIALALIGFLLALRGEREELAGGLLVLLVSAPRLTGVLAIFFLWWIIYQRRWRVLWGFLMGLAVLLALSFLFLPDWIPSYIRSLPSFFIYHSGTSTIDIFASWSPVVGQRLGWVLAGGLLLMLFFFWGNTRTSDFRTLLWTACLTLSVTPLLGFPMVPSDYPFLFLPLMLFLAILIERGAWLKRWGAVGIVFLVMMVGFWLLVFALAKANAYTTLANTLILLLPLLLGLGLMWMRWWFIHTVPIGLEMPR